jgi:hypothetical protein
MSINSVPLTGYAYKTPGVPNPGRPFTFTSLSPGVVAITSGGSGVTDAQGRGFAVATRQGTTPATAEVEFLCDGIAARSVLTVQQEATAAAASAAVPIGASPTPGQVATVTLTAGARYYPDSTSLAPSRLARVFVGSYRQFTCIARDAAGKVLYDLPATVQVADGAMAAVVLRHSDAGTVEGEVSGLTPGLTSVSVTIGGLTSSLTFLVEAQEQRTRKDGTVVKLKMPNSMDTSYRAPSTDAVPLHPMNFAELKAAFANPALNSIIYIDKAAADAGAYDSGVQGPSTQGQAKTPAYDINLRMFSTPGTRGTVVIRGSTWDQLGNPEATLTAAQEALLPKLTFNQGTYTWVKVMGNSRNVRFQGVNLYRGELAADAQYSASNMVLQVGSGGGSSGDETAGVAMVDNIVMEKCVMDHADYDGTQPVLPDVHRLVAAYGSRIGFVRSRFKKAGSANIDTQLITIVSQRAGSDGIFHIEDNWLGFATEPLAIGGFPNLFDNMVPTSTSILGNHCDKGVHVRNGDPAPAGVPNFFVTKCGFFECKLGYRILIEGNYAHYQPVGSQSQDGSPWDIKVQLYAAYYGDYGATARLDLFEPRQGTEDVCIRYNVWDRMAGPGQIVCNQKSDGTEGQSNRALERFVNRDNIYARPLPDVMGHGGFFLDFSTPSLNPGKLGTDLFTDHITIPVVGSHSFGHLGNKYGPGYPPPQDTFQPDHYGAMEVTDSVMGPSELYGLGAEGYVSGNGSHQGKTLAALNFFFDAWLWDRNALVGQDPLDWSGVGAANQFPATLAEVFVGDVLTASGRTDAGLDAYVTKGAYTGKGARVPLVKAWTAGARALGQVAGPFDHIVIPQNGASIAAGASLQVAPVAVDAAGVALAVQPAPSAYGYNFSSGGGIASGISSGGLITTPNNSPGGAATFSALINIGGVTKEVFFTVNVVVAATVGLIIAGPEPFVIPFGGSRLATVHVQTSGGTPVAGATVVASKYAFPGNFSYAGAGSDENASAVTNASGDATFTILSGPEARGGLIARFTVGAVYDDMAVSIAAQSSGGSSVVRHYLFRETEAGPAGKGADPSDSKVFSFVPPTYVYGSRTAGAEGIIGEGWIADPETGTNIPAMSDQATGGTNGTDARGAGWARWPNSDPSYRLFRVRFNATGKVVGVTVALGRIMPTGENYDAQAFDFFDGDPGAGGALLFSIRRTQPNGDTSLTWVDVDGATYGTLAALIAANATRSVTLATDSLYMRIGAGNAAPGYNIGQSSIDWLRLSVGA